MAAAEGPTYFVPYRFFKPGGKSKSASSSWLFICQLCPGKLEISTNVKSRINLRKHISRKHAQLLVKFDQECKSHDKSTGHGQECQILSTGWLATAVTIESGTRSTIKEWFGARKLTQKQLDIAVMKYLATSVLPFNHVEHDGFKDFVDTLSPGVKGMLKTAKPYKSRAADMMAEIKQSIILAMPKAKKICVTADHWTSCRKGYIGVTGHWFGATNNREHACLALRRVRGRVTYDVIADILNDIFQEYGISSKISHCVTDSGSNIVKAFYVFTAQEAGDESDAEDERDAEASAVEIEGILQAHDAGDETIELPPHMKCAARRFNLIGAKDAESGLQNQECKNVYRG